MPCGTQEVLDIAHTYSTRRQHRPEFRMVAALIIAGAVIGGPATRVLGGLTCALVPSQDRTPAVMTLLDLVEIELAKDAGLTLLDRTHIDHVLREKKLSLALAGSGAGARRIWRQVFRADLLAVFSLREHEGAAILTVLCIETKNGIRISRDLLVLGGPIDDSVGFLVQRIRNATQRIEHGITRVFAVPPFESKDLALDHSHLQRTYALLAEQAVETVPGAAVVEFDQAKSIAKELALSEGYVELQRQFPIYVLGDYRNEGVDANRRITINIEMKQGEKSLGRVSHPGMAPKDAPAFIKEAIARISSDALGETRVGNATTPTPSEVEFLAKRAHAFRLLGEFEHAIDLAEAALLLDPTQADLHHRICETVCTLQSIWHRPEGFSRDLTETEELCEDARRHLEYSLQAARHLRAYLRLRPVRDHGIPRDCFDCLARSIDPYLPTRDIREEFILPFQNGEIADADDAYFDEMAGTAHNAECRFETTVLYRWSADTCEIREPMRALARAHADLLLDALKNCRSDACSLKQYAVGNWTTSFLRTDTTWSDEERMAVAARFLETAAEGGASFSELCRIADRASALGEINPDLYAELLERLASAGNSRLDLLVRYARVLARLRESKEDDAAWEELWAINAELHSGDTNATACKKVPVLAFWGHGAGFATLLRKSCDEYRRIANWPSYADWPGDLTKSQPEDGVVFSRVSLEVVGSDGLPEQPNKASRWVNCGNGIDVFWADSYKKSALFVMTTPGSASVVKPPDGGSWNWISDIQWDGRWVWVASTRSGGSLAVLDLETMRWIAEFSATDALPPFTRCCQMAPISTGRVCVVGAIAYKRSWIADVTIVIDRGGAVTKNVDVFFEARQTPDPDRPIGKRSIPAEVAFVPTYAKTIGQGTADPYVVIGRGPGRALVAELNTRSVRVGFGEWDGSGQMIIPASDRLYHFGLRWREESLEIAVLSELFPPAFETRELASWRIERLDNSVGIVMSLSFVDGRFLHLVGRHWTSIALRDPSVLIRRPISGWELAGMPMWMARSAHYGLLVSGGEGLVRVALPSGWKTPSETTATTLPVLLPDPDTPAPIFVQAGEPFSVVQLPTDKPGDLTLRVEGRTIAIQGSRTTQPDGQKSVRLTAPDVARLAHFELISRRIPARALRDVLVYPKSWLADESAAPLDGSPSVEIDPRAPKWITDWMDAVDLPHAPTSIHSAGIGSDSGTVIVTGIRDESRETLDQLFEIADKDRWVIAIKEAKYRDAILLSPGGLSGPLAPMSRERWTKPLLMYLDEDVCGIVMNRLPVARAEHAAAIERFQRQDKCVIVVRLDWLAALGRDTRADRMLVELLSRRPGEVESPDNAVYFLNPGAADPPDAVLEHIVRTTNDREQARVWILDDRAGPLRSPRRLEAIRVDALRSNARLLVLEGPSVAGGKSQSKTSLWNHTRGRDILEGSDVIRLQGRASDASGLWLELIWTLTELGVTLDESE